MNDDAPPDDVNGSLRRLIAECRSNGAAWTVGRIYANHPLEIHAQPVSASDPAATSARLRAALRIADSRLLPRDLATTVVLMETARAARALPPAATGATACQQTADAIAETVARANMVQALRSADADGATGAADFATRLENAPDTLVAEMRNAGSYFDSLSDPPLVRYLLTRGTPLFPKYLYEETGDQPSR